MIKGPAVSGRHGPRLGKMAEREGFEPSVEVSPHTRLAGEHLRPLGHLSCGPREQIRTNSPAHKLNSISRVFQPQEPSWDFRVKFCRNRTPAPSESCSCRRGPGLRCKRAGIRPALSGRAVVRRRDWFFLALPQVLYIFLLFFLYMRLTPDFLLVFGVNDLHRS
jgi:hypothetical protein